MNFLIDINGVLYVGKEAVSGAQETISFLREKKHKIRFVSNATRSCRKTLLQKLASMGLDVREEELFTAPQAAVKYILDSGKSSCFLLSTGDVSRDFDEADIKLTEKDPDYVVVGDAGLDFTFEHMNKAFNLLLRDSEFIAMESDRFWRSESGLELCAGPYVKALEYASGKKATLVGKPSKNFFRMALEDMCAKASETIMIGDDPITDILGAQRVGIRAYLVKTGKFEANELQTSKVKPDAILDSLADLPNHL